MKRFVRMKRDTFGPLQFGLHVLSQLEREREHQCCRWDSQLNRVRHGIQDGCARITQRGCSKGSDSDWAILEDCQYYSYQDNHETEEPLCLHAYKQTLEEDWSQ